MYKAYETASILEGRCYQHIAEIACHLNFPQCDPVTQGVIHPCREMCWDFKEACMRKWFSMVSKVHSIFGWNASYLSNGNWSHVVDCDYLPSLHDNIPCFYKPVSCDSPPIINNTRILNSTIKNIYHLHDMFQYACVHESFKMIGKSSITCLYSGEWSHSSPRCIHQPMSSFNSFNVVLPVPIIPLFIYISLTLFIWGKKTKHQSFTRNKKYDAFVCYSYDGEDANFTENIVPVELGEEHGFN